MRNVICVLIVVVLLAGVGVYLMRRHSDARADIEPFTAVRQQVTGKHAEDVSKITVEQFWPSPEPPVVITDKHDIAELLAGLREAVRPKEQDAMLGPRIGIYWVGKTRPSYFIICIDYGPDQAFGERFTRAYNRVVPPGYRVKSHRK